ncbi:MAG: ATP cone domain-containing protein, partial [Nitrosopumilus sp.]|nr:ATP cone domain-containing protein [Nitrosopumilus sp.]
MKANGHKVLFNQNKILNTCHRAGANKKTSHQILKKVRSRIYNGIKTKEIYKFVLQAISEEKGG